jgi:hypothetical protein
MTISIFVRDVDSQLVKKCCPECSGSGHAADGLDCYFCDDGYFTEYVYPEGMEPISMGNTNAATVIAAIDKQFNPKDPCGYWDRDRMSVVLTVVEAMLATDAYDFLVRETEVEGRITHVGIDSVYLKQRLEQIKNIILAARKAGKTVAYA